jgi:hypothetical protein
MNKSTRGVMMVNKPFIKVSWSVVSSEVILLMISAMMAEILKNALFK